MTVRSIIFPTSQSLWVQDIPHEKRAFPSRILSTIISKFKELTYQLSIVKYRLDDLIYWQKRFTVGKNTESEKGLFVLFHGIHGHPSIWAKYRDQIAKKGYHVYVPYITKGGDCSLEEAAESIIQYIKESRKQKVCLIGVSNGSPIAAKVASQLNGTVVKLVAIAGPFFGSEKMDTAIKIFGKWLVGLFYSKEAMARFTWANDCAKKLITEMQSHPPKESTYLAASNDGTVTPMRTSFPKTTRKAAYYIVENRDHNGIVEAAREHIIRDCFRFLDS